MGDLSKWNVGSGMGFKSMFDGATSFSRTFHKAENFNSNISKWNVGRVTTFESMFNGASKFNLNLCHWNMHYAFESNMEFTLTGCQYPFDATPDYACYEC